MQEPKIIIEEVTDPVQIARSHARSERFKRNSDWLQAHWDDVLPQARGRFLAVAGEKAYFADTPAELARLVNETCPDDDGALFKYVYPTQRPRIYANCG